MTTEPTEQKRIITFAGIDSWNRPVFKIEGKGKPYFVGHTEILFSNYQTSEKYVKNALKQQAESICFFGSSFGCEPEGWKLSPSVIEDLKQYFNS